jgi:hypothetical protein
MTTSDLLTAVLTAAAVVSAVYAFLAVRQTKQMRKDAQRPFVWVDIRPDDEDGQTLLLIVGNSGPTMARNIRVSFSPPLPTGDAALESAVAQQRLSVGLASLAPGRQLAWALGASHQVSDNDEWSDHAMTVLADGPFGPLDPLKYTFSIRDILDTRITSPGTLRGVTRAINHAGSQPRSPLRR